MSGGAYYNEIDPFAAAWLRELIAAGQIAPGIVDERDIRDVRPDELAGFDQCHFFAGIGVWSYALRQAGWPDDRKVWTGSCPCQPFSEAGRRLGFADERHLWPALFHLIEQCEPVCVFGEQVAAKNVDPWIDLVQADVESVGYAFGCVPLASAGFGAPNVRHRTFWVADATTVRHSVGLVCSRFADRWQGPWAETVRRSVACRLEDSALEGLGRKHQPQPDVEAQGIRLLSAGPSGLSGYWDSCDWIECKDGFRPVEPGTFPLAHGSAARVGRLRGYGNAINAEAATAFIAAYLDHLSHATALPLPSRERRPDAPIVGAANPSNSVGVSV